MRAASLAPVLAAATLAACSAAQEPASASAPEAPPAATPPVAANVPPADPALDKAIADFIGDNADSTRTAVRLVGGGERRIALVYLVGMNWCGTGGCNLLILRPDVTGWTTIGYVSRVRNPVRVLDTSTNGLPDIGVAVSGGGGPPAYEAKLSFDGRIYPRYPSDEPLVGAEGTVVITDADIPPVV